MSAIASPKLFQLSAKEEARLERERLVKRLAELGERRGDHHELAIELSLTIGETLLGVYDIEGLTFREAAQLLGVTRPGAYKMMEAARKAGRG